MGMDSLSNLKWQHQLSYYQSDFILKCLVFNLLHGDLFSLVSHTRALTVLKQSRGIHRGSLSDSVLDEFFDPCPKQVLFSEVLCLKDSVLDVPITRELSSEGNVFLFLESILDPLTLTISAVTD